MLYIVKINVIEFYTSKISDDYFLTYASLE